MSYDDPELDDVLSPLRDGPVSLSSVETERARRARIMPALKGAVRAVPAVRAARVRRSRQRNVALIALAVAAAALLGWFRPDFLREPPAAVAANVGVRVLSQGQEPLAWEADGANIRFIAGADELSSAGELHAREGSRASLITEAGAHVEVLPRSRLRMLGKARNAGVETLSLLEGEVHCRVPPLAKGRSFVVATPSTRVVVHGTEFHVRVGGQRGSCISVREGLVEVQTDGVSVWLGPGSDYGCEEEESAPQKTARTKSRSRSRARGRGIEARELEEQAPKELLPEGTLALETRIMADALRAEQQGNKAAARTLFSRLIANHPSSPLVPDAEAGLARLR
jgi:ferric-dicitrate binding protein FerR (iron transport regulator)